jgi:hypothetical protein
MRGDHLLPDTDLDSRIAYNPTAMTIFQAPRKPTPSRQRYARCRTGETMKHYRGLALIALSWLAVIGPSHAQQYPPLPPSRPRSAAPTAPTSTVQQPESPDDEVSTLPPPSRNRIEQCATEWRGMKRNGADAGITWRSFAQACFKR